MVKRKLTKQRKKGGCKSCGCGTMKRKRKYKSLKKTKRYRKKR